MPSGDADFGLWGRRDECDALMQLVASARRGESQVLVLRGEAGMGKSALLRYLMGSASECRVERASGVQSEMEIPFAGVQQLCAPMLDRLDRLPRSQRDALASAFGLTAGNAPDRLLIGLAVLSLLADVADEQPLICIVDDMQWLDSASAQTLLFVARRLLAEPIALVLATREGDPDLASLPELEVTGLNTGDASALLDSGLRGPIDRRVRDRILAEARGNPLALLELPRGLTPTEMAFGFGRRNEMPLTNRIEHEFASRLAPLPVDTRLLLLTAAVEPLGDAPLLWRAAERLGIGPGAAAPAATAGLIDFGLRVQFRHPLVRSAIYRAAPPSDRHDVHRALSEVTDAEVDPDRKAWHRACATAAPDENVAADLERSAGRAQARGGLSAVGAFLERAAELTPDPSDRSRRALDAAQAKLQAGAFDSALVLLANAEEGPQDALRLARIDLVRGQIAFASSHGNDAAPLLLAAAQRFESIDIRLARETYLEAIAAAMNAGRLGHGIGPQDVARLAGRAPRPLKPVNADLLLDGLAVLFTDGYAAAVPMFRATLRAFCGDDNASGGGRRWMWLASALAAGLWDDESWHIVAVRYVESTRASGALSELLLALNLRVAVHLSAGELAAAAALVVEIEAVRGATGSKIGPYDVLTLAAFRGDERTAEATIATSMAEMMARGDGTGLNVHHWASALLYNGLGRYNDAVTAASQAANAELGLANRSLAELVEAAARSGQQELAAEALDRLVDTTHVSGTDWALGVEARSRALVTAGDAAEQLYREAIDRLERTRVRMDLGRAHLLYGEWLRREHRRVDARVQLRVAHEMLDSMGATAFAERARRELLATGETVRTRSGDARDVLTAQEKQVAWLAAAGQTNPEIGSRLFISPRTVEYHLHKVFTKLDVTARKGLRRALLDAGLVEPTT